MQTQEPYTTVEAVYGYMGIEAPSESSDEYSQMESWILAMSMWIDRYCNRNLYRTEEETFTYDGNGQEILVIEDVIEPTVSIDGREVAVDGYPQRKDYVSRIRQSDGFRWHRGRNNVTVTGVHSMHLYLPEDVQQVCTVLVAGIYNAKDVQGKVGTSERIGNYQVNYRETSQQKDFDNVKAILSGYKRIAL